MQHNDRQYGIPFCEYNDTKANIEAITGLSEGCIAYATDTNELGTYDGSDWQWANLDYINQDVTTTGTPTFNSLTVTGSVVINEGGGDNDTRIEGDTDENLFYADAGNDRIGIKTTSPDAALHVVSGSYPVTIIERNELTSDIVYLTQAYKATKTTNMSDGFGCVISFIIEDDAAVANQIVQFGGERNGADDTGKFFINVANGGAFGDYELTVLNNGNVGIGTMNPGQILDINSGSGNMIADGYDSHPSFSYKKENITDVGEVLPYLVASPPKRFNRKPHVSAEELRKFAIKTHLEAWIKEFGGEVVDGELQGDDYRGGKLKLIKDQELLNLIDTEADRLREERRQEKKWQRKYVGLIIDDDNIINNLPEIIVKNDDDEIYGWNVDSYIGMLHKAIIELSKRIDKLEGVKL